MSDEAWEHEIARSLGMLLLGGALGETDRRGNPLMDDDFLLLLNASSSAVDFQVPAARDGPWRVLLDTAQPQRDDASAWPPGSLYSLESRSLALLTVTAR
jgi:glycogen operon protein